MQNYKLKLKILISVVLLKMFCLNQLMAEENISNSCMSQYFDRITVSVDEIVIIDTQKSRYVNKFIIKPNKEIELHQFDNEGKENGIYKTDDIYAYIGEEMGEKLELVEWKESHASFKLAYWCGEPACIPSESRDCMLEVNESWEQNKQ